MFNNVTFLADTKINKDISKVEKYQTKIDKYR